MRNIWIYSYFQLKFVLKNWKALLLLIVAPLVLLAVLYTLFISLFHSEDHLSPIKMAIVDQDKTVETALVIQQLENNEHLQKSVEMYHTDETSATELMEKDAIAAIVLIPEGFSRDVRKGINTPVKVISNVKKPLQSLLIRNLIDSAAKLTSAAQSGINTIWDVLDEEGISRKMQEREFKKSVFAFTLHIVGREAVFQEFEYSHLFQTNLTGYYALSFYVLLIFIWSFGFIFLLKREDSNVFKRQLQLRGVTFFQQVAADQIVLFLLLVAPSIFIGGVIFYLLDFKSRVSAWMLAIILIVSACSTLFLLVHTIVQKFKLYQIVGMIFLITGVLLGGHIVPTVYLPVWLENISAFSVNRWALEHVLSLSSGEGKIALQLLLISGIQFLLTVVSSFMFRRGDL